MTDKVVYRKFYAVREGDKIAFGIDDEEDPDRIALVIQVDGDEIILEPGWLAEQEEGAEHHRTWRHFLLRTIGLPLSVARRLFVVLPPLYALAGDEALMEYVQWIATQKIKVAGIGSKAAEALREHLIGKGLLDTEAVKHKNQH